MTQTTSVDPVVYQRFADRLAHGACTREENAATHFCVMFLPYRTKDKKVFMVHHKKANLWIAPGGHIDRGETVFETLNREIGEELGIPNFFADMPRPIMLSHKEIDNGGPCKEHYDLWFALPTDGADFVIDPHEFHDARWFTIDEAIALDTDSNNLKALSLVEETLLS